VDKYGMSAEEQREGESLDDRLAEEVPDVTAANVDPRDAEDVTDADEALAGSDANPESHGEHAGQIDGAPEDGESLFPVVE
jgi:hypothetical protein